MTNFKDIKLLVTDVDGVMTDGGMYFTSNGDEMKRFNAKDGVAINMCRDRGIESGIISHGHHAGIVETRASVLGITRVYVGKEPKIDVLSNWVDAMGINMNQVAYIGDDLNDIPVMQAVGVSACPSDGSKAVKRIADIVLETNGGHGCIREFVEEYLLK